MSAPQVRLFAAALLVCSCSYTTSSTNADPKLSGELWYVRTDMFLGIPVSSSVYYCPPPTAGAAECLQAHMAEQSADTSPGSAATAPTAKADSDEDDPDPTIFWSVVTKAKGAAEACADVRAALAKDETCSAEQCRAPLALASVHIARCAKDDPEIESVRALQMAWKGEVKGSPDACFRALLRLARSRADDVGKRYASQCLASRAPNAIEKALLATGAASEVPKPPDAGK